MTAIKYIILCFVALHTCFADDLECDDNEEVDEFPAFCKSYYCPKSEEESRDSQPCKQPDPCPEPSCKSTCKFNHRRNAEGICINTRNCPAFNCSGPYQEYHSCPPLCPTDDCDQATPDGRCPRIGRIGIVLECSPGCRCIKGYWKKNGVCVPYAECGKNDSNDAEDTPKQQKSIYELMRDLI